MIILHRSPVLDCFENKAKINNVVGVLKNKYIVKIQAKYYSLVSEEETLLFSNTLF